MTYDRTHNIQLAPMLYELLTYDEAVMYCFCLDYHGKSWRLPTFNEYSGNGLIWGWYTARDHNDRLPVRPVRDLC